MTHRSFSTPNSGLRVFHAALLSALLIMMPFVQLAAAEKRSEVRGQRPESGSQAAEGSQQDAAKNAAAENVFLNAPIPKAAPEAPALLPAIVATKDDGLATATTVAPGGTINYSVNIKNNGTLPADDATGVVFTDIIDAHTTLVVGSAVAAVSDRYSAIGNVQLSVPDGSTDLLANDIDPDTGNNTGMTVTVETKSSTACTGGCSNNVTINADGSFTYDPPVGFSGTDTFTYTAHSTVGPGTATETVTITVANEIWFINNNAGACPGAPCDGRLSHPFTSLAAFTGANLGGPGQPGDNDWIFIYESALDYAGPATLRNGQKFIGQDATASLATLTGFPAASGSDQLPVMNSGNGTFVNITGANVNGINLLSGNTLRGFRVGNVGTGTKISGTSFGTLLVGNSGSPDVLLHGTGRALNLTTGTLAVTGGFVSVTTTSSGTQGISLSGVADSDGAGAGAFSFGSTTVSGSTTQGILIGTTPADLNFGATSVTGGTNGVSFQSNAGGTRTFVTLGISGSANEAFLHGSGGGNVTVTAAATLSSAGSAISVSAPAATNAINFQAATSATSTGAGVTAVNWAGAANTSMTFNSLSITRNNGTALNASGGGTINVTNATGSITNTTAGGPAIVAANIALNANFLAINSSAGLNGVSLTAVTGTSNFGTGQLTGTISGATFLISAGTTTVTYSGNITQGAAAPIVSIADHTTGTITFQTGTLSATLGTGILLDNADGIYSFSGITTLNGGNAGIDIIDGAGGTITFGASTTITNPSGVAVDIDGTVTAVTAGISIAGSISKTSGGRLIDFNNYDTGTATISATLSCTTSCDGIEVTNNGANSGTVNFSAATKTLSTVADTAVNLNDNDNGNVNFTGGGLDIDTSSGAGFSATNGGTVTVTTGANPNTVDTTTGTGIIITDTNIGGTGVTFRSVNTVGAPNGINLSNTGTVAGNFFSITGNAGDCTTGAGTCTGGRIQNSAGANATTSGIGVRLNNTRNITLAHMRIDGSQNFGIYGNTVTTIAFSDLILDGPNGNDAGSREGSAAFDNLFGTNTITTSHFTGGYTNDLRVSNTAATALTGLTVTASSFTTTNTSGVGEDGIQIEGLDGTNMTVTVGGALPADGNTFNLNEGDHFNVTPQGSAIMAIVFRNNTLTGDGTIASPTTLGGGVTLNAGLDFTGQMTFNVSNNTISGTTAGSAININKGGSGLFSGTINSNIIGQAGVAFSGCAQACSGINLISQHLDGELVVNVTNNTIRRVTTSGIRALIRDTLLDGPGAGTANTSFQLTATGNNISEPQENLPISSTGRAINVELVTGTDEANICADIGGAGALANTIGGTWNGGGGTNIRVLTRNNPTGQYRLPGYGGTIYDETAVATYLSGRNNATSATGDVNPNSTGPGFTGGAACTSPLAWNYAPAAQQREYLASNAPAENDKPASRAAYWMPIAAALTGSASEVSSRIAPSAHQAEVSSQRSEVSDQRSEIRTHHAPSSKLDTRITTRDEETGLRAHYATLSKLATRSATAAPAPMSGETVTANIGNLPAGGSVTITFQVTVNNPPALTLLSPPRVENQGTVSGSNFANVLTDDTDPSFPGAADKTRTLIDLYGTTTTVVSSGSPTDEGDPVTFTATVAPNNLPFAPPLGTIPTGTVQFLNGATPITCTEGSTSIQTLNGLGQATCTTSALTSAGSPHTINVNYNGDGNFDPSNGNTTQVINACTQNPVVINTSDSGPGSLRAALAAVCTAPNNNITFNIPIGDPGFVGGVYTITVLTELAVTKNVNVIGPNSVTNTNPIVISGNNLTRVLNVNATRTATIRNLTFSGGNSGALAGGGILNDGTLNLINSTVSGSTTTLHGGGIYNSGTGTLNLVNSTLSGNSASTVASSAGGGVGNDGTLTIINSTVSGNTAGVGGGGVFSNSGTTTIINSTIVENITTTNGGGIRADASVTLRNTIVANSTGPDDISGVYDTTNGFNLIEDPGVVVIAANNITGQDPVLGPLANNGGSTFTHALLATSPAVEAGSNANLPTDTFDVDGDAITAETLPVDQRGVGYPRTADSADLDTTQTVDIGAFELHPSIENITDKTTAEDTAVPQITFNLGDGTGALITAPVTATSSNTTLVPNASILVGGSGSTRTLDISPAADANSPADGTTTITVTVTATNGRTAVDTFVVTVTEVNDAPVPTNDTVPDVAEDSGTYVIPFATLLGNDTNKGAANESGQTLNITAVSSPTGGLVGINGTNVEFTPTADFSGPAGFTYTVTDDGTTNLVADPKSGNATVSFNVTAVNDPPSFTIAGNPAAVNEDAGAQTVNSFATSISSGPGESQTLTFNITPTGTTGNLSFASGPAIDTSTGNLTYTSNADTNGTASFSVTLSDNGGGTDTSAPQSFTITVNAVDDAPTFTLAAGPTVAEDAGAQSVPSFASNFQPGPVTATDESTQTLVGYTLSQTGSTGGLTFSGTPAIDNAGTLTYTATGNTAGTATFDVVATDTGSNTPPNVNQSAAQSFTITVNAANDAPVNTVPGPQGTASNTPLTFSIGNGNQISVADADAGASTIQVTLTATDGTLSLSGTTGLNFGCGGCAGDGTADTTMTFQGTLTDVNAALNGLTYTPNLGFSGPATLTITSNDLGNTGSGGPLTDTDVVNIQVATEIRINDASSIEPASPATIDMVFTVSLNSPAPAGGVSVNFSTQNEPAGPGKAVAGTCGNPGADYVTTNGTVNFAAGQQVKTINVPICSDAVAEPDETFKVLLSGEVGATLIDGDATGTIKSANTAGAVLISELRTSGPGGAGDDFVEIYNNSNSPLTVAASDASAGYGLYKMGADCNATPVLIGVIPNGTVIPARGHYLFVGSAYSLTNYGGSGAAAGNLTMSADIENDGNVGLFSTSNVAGISSVNRLDAVGFGVNVGGACNLLREGSTLGATAGSTAQYSFFRKLCEPGVSCTGTPKDTNDNLADFMFADTQGTFIAGIPQKLGAPGPENISSPIKRDPQVLGVFLDSTKPSSAVPNRSRDFTSDPGNNSTFGTMTIRRRIVNNTGAPVTRLRFRIIDMTTFPSAPGTADLRARTGVNETSVGPVNDATTCTASGAGAPPCTVNVEATTLEAPPTQPNGGGMNSSLSSGTITLGTPLANGASINVNFLLGIQQTGTFRFFIIIEALP